VLSIGVFLGFFALAINQAYLWQTRQEIHLSTDAAGLAATALLADDDFLTNDPYRVPAIVQRARLAAHAYAARNLVRGHPLELHDANGDPPKDDLAFGVLPTPRGGSLELIDFRQSVDPNLLLRINTVRLVTGHTADRGKSVGLILGPLVGASRMDLEVETTVTWDQEVRGFRPLAYQNVPLVPIALLSDPSGVNSESWEHQVEQGNGPDQYRFDRESLQFTADSAGDGLHEFRARLTTSVGQVGLSNTALLALGAGTIPETSRQVRGGLTAADLAELGGNLLYGPTNDVVVPGTQVGPDAGSPDLAALLAALEQLRDSGQARIWPLYQEIDTVQGTVQVTRFVAARVISATLLGPGQPVEIRLQPARLATAASVTAMDLGMSWPVPLNAYIGKVRVIE
jgi:hypothetical protein